jgi:hypothetical protein
MSSERNDELDNNIANSGRARARGLERQIRPRGTAAVKFLQRLAPNRAWVLTAIVPDGAALTRTFDNAEKARGFIAQHNAAGCNLNSINPTKNALTKKARKDDIARVEYLHVDGDPSPDETPEQFKARLSPQIAAYQPKATFVVDSGNGIQLLWRLREPVAITGNDVVEDVEARNHALALAFHANPSTRNIDRLFRLPGTINYPTRSKRDVGRKECKAKLLEFNKVAYPLSDFRPYQAPIIATTTTQTKTATTTELPANLRTLLLSEGCGGYETRSELVFAFLAGAIRAGLPDSTIIAACLDHTCRGKGIYQHIAEDGGRQCAERQLQRAREKVVRIRNDKDPHTWEEPDVSILDDQRGELPAFPLDALQPKELREWVTRSASSSGTTVDHVAVPLLGVAASLIGGARCGRAGPFAQPTTLWTFMIGDSGTGKTPGLDATRKPLSALEHRRAPHVALLRRKHDERTARAKAAAKKWESAVEKAVRSGAITPRKPPDAEDPGQFVEPRLYTTDWSAWLCYCRFVQMACCC